MKKISYLISVCLYCFTVSTRAQTAWEFNGTTAPTGWLMVNYQTSSDFSAGHWNLITPATAQTAYIGYQVSAAASQINTETFKFVKINLKNETPQASARFYFWYNGSPVFIPFSLQPNSDYTEYTIDVANSDAFTGNGPTAVNVGKKWTYNAADAGTYIKMPYIRFDMPSVIPPAAGAGVQPVSTDKLVSVDYVRFVTSLAPQVNLSPASSVTSISAAFNGEVINDGGSAVTDRGLLWSTAASLISGYKARQGSGTGAFSQTLDNLMPATTYYVKSYAVNAAGISYSAVQSFTTANADSAANLASLTLSDSITLGEDFNPNKTNYTITVASPVTGVAVTPVVYDSNATVKVNNIPVANNTASDIIALSPGANTIVVEVTNIVNATSKTYTLLLNVDAQYGWDFTAPTIPAGWSQLNYHSSMFADGYWNLVTPLTPSSAYIRYQTSASASNIHTTIYKYVKIRLKNATPQTSGRFYFPYGLTNVFIPFNIAPYADYTDYVIDLAHSDAFSGNVGDLVNVGKKWTYNPNDSLTIPKMTSIRFDLPSTIPPAGGYGVQYGSLNQPISVDDIRFLSVGAPAGVITSGPLSMTDTPSVVLEGEVISDGGATVSERGIVWGENSNPTVVDNKVQMGADTGAFLQTIEGFTKGTLYYARTYAINANGTTYGNTVTFLMKTVPLQLTTDAPQPVTDTCILLAGSVGKDGGAMVFDRGIVWSETPAPTITDHKIEICSGLGPFSKNNVFESGKTYYLRTYAINSEGVAYGNEQTLTLSADSGY
ncbi:cadherin-like beta sandwich domain-containing protein [Parapedobacter sp. DT-150]|uniref:cadherin-like beta sandwich domain-containing protein n=1 Tax=Parapedobacter sp. DT-150 TaxID=3396162 RepID=UPI003F1E0B2E